MWAAHLFIGLTAHQQLRTPGFDLSVFDYAIWNTGTGGPAGFVPMFGFSLLAQHFMPTLLLLSPFGALFHSPVYLLVLQSTLFVAGAYVMYRFAALQIPNPYALALLVAYLLSRRTHAAATNYAYIESAEPLLIFGALLAWTTGRRTLYWLCFVLALGCKEDVAVYFGLFGAIEAFANPAGPLRRQGLFTAAASVAWLAAAVFGAIPYFASVYGLSPQNPFLEGRFGIDGVEGIKAALARAFSMAALGKVFTVTSAVGFLCILSPRRFPIVLVGLLLNLAANPGTNQSGVIGHYLWPILPWLFAAAVDGAHRLGSRGLRWLPWVVALIAVADTPLPGALTRSIRSESSAELARSQLRTLDLSLTIVAQANIIPQLPRHNRVFGYGVPAKGQPEPELVLLTTSGDLWPLGTDGVHRELAVWRAKANYQEVSAGPLFAFRRVDR